MKEMTPIYEKMVRNETEPKLRVNNIWLSSYHTSLHPHGTGNVAASVSALLHTFLWLFYLKLRTICGDDRECAARHQFMSCVPTHAIMDAMLVV